MAAETVPVLVGCTGAGKSDAALAYAGLRRGMEIVNGDSRQVYRGMDIGTDKPGPEERARVPHHLLDMSDPDTLLSAGWFAREAKRVLTRIRASGGIPLVVGGSALYLMAMAGMTDPLPERNEPLRAVLTELEEEAPGVLHRMLRNLDPSSGASIPPSDRVRTLRAVEICLETGSRASGLRRGGTPVNAFRFILLDLPREELRRRVDLRVERMMERGLLEEVKALVARGFHREPVLGRTIGYAQILDHLEGQCSLSQAVSAIKTHTWRYSRRQRNMFQRLPGLLTATGPKEARELLDWSLAHG